MDLNDFLFGIKDTMNEYLDEKKVFIKNPKRFADIKEALDRAKTLFPEAKISLEDDPLQMGVISLVIEFFDISIAGEEEKALFNELTAKAECFEIYPVGDEKINFALTFYGAMERIK